MKAGDVVGCYHPEESAKLWETAIGNGQQNVPIALLTL